MSGAGEGTITPAVVLRTRATAEADLVVVLLTPLRGRVECHARGARKSRRRFPGGLPVGARGEATIGRAGRASLPPLEGFTATSDHLALGRNLESFAHVAYLCELAEQLVTGSAPDPAAFAGLCEAIAGALTQPSALGLRRFELGLLERLGALPAFDRCGVCGAEPRVDLRGVAFSPSRGGVVCAAHAEGARRMLPALPGLALDLTHGEAIDEATLAVPLRRELRDLCRDLIQPHLRAPLRSVAFFAQLPRG